MIKIYPKSRIQKLNSEIKQYADIIEYSDPVLKKECDLLVEQRLDEENSFYTLVIGKRLDYKLKSKTGRKIILIDTISSNEKMGIEALVKQDEKFEGPIRFWEGEQLELV